MAVDNKNFFLTLLDYVILYFRKGCEGAQIAAL